ncbi:MAG: hypothetical protein SNJ64_07175, partial [Endomicrobiia bacterium]
MLKSLFVFVAFIFFSTTFVISQSFTDRKMLAGYDLKSHNQKKVKSVSWEIFKNENYIYEDYGDNLFSYCIPQAKPIVEFDKNGFEIYRNFAIDGENCLWPENSVDFYFNDTSLTINIYDISKTNLILVGKIKYKDFYLNEITAVDWHYTQTNEEYNSKIEYNNDNKIVSKYIYFPDLYDPRIMNTYLTEYKYEGLNLIEEISYNLGVPAEKKVFEYDRKNNPVSVKYYQNEIDENYDYKFQLVEEVIYSGNKTLRKSASDKIAELTLNSVMTKDKYGRIKKIELFMPDGTKNTIVTKYKNKGKEVISRMILPNGKLNYVYTLKYDDNFREIFSSFIFP